MRADMSNTEAIVFASLYPEERVNSMATVPTVLEGEIGGIIPALPANPKNI